MNTKPANVVELIPGTQAVAQRLANADAWLIDTLKTAGKLADDEQARRAAAYFVKHKIAKRDVAMGRYTFSWGGFLEPVAIQRAAALRARKAR